MKRLLLATALLVGLVGPGMAQTSDPAVYITPTDGNFEVYLAAAMSKKKVPVTVVTRPEGAAYTLTATAPDIEEVGTSSKVLNCIFGSCGGNEDKASTSVQLVDEAGTVVWSYSVNKSRGSKNSQSMAEAIAKHLKNDYLKKRK